MKVLIATPLYPPDIGGPATYCVGLENAIPQMGHQVQVVSPGPERKFPSGIRHLIYFYRLWKASDREDAILALDTFSVGLPAILVSLLRGVPLVVRTGGDFLWEMYVDRTQDLCSLEKFYLLKHTLSLKEMFIHRATSFLLAHSTKIIFSTEWQRGIWSDEYHFSHDRSVVVPNAFRKTNRSLQTLNKKSFLWAGRRIPIKNIPFLERVFSKVRQQNPEVTLDMAPQMSRDELLECIKGSYALVLPSLTDISPNYILDGLSVGKPFVMTTETGIRDFAGGCGFFVDPSDEEAWVSAVIQMADDTRYQRFRDRINLLGEERTYLDIAKEIIEIIEGSVIKKALS